MVLRPRLLAFFVPLTLPLLLHAQNGAPVTLSGAQVRVEVSSVNGRLKERYQAREGSRWITIASSAGETEGSVSVHGANGVVLTGALRSVSVEHGALVERLSAGPNEITRTIELTASGPWAHVATRLEPRGRVELHSVADSFRFEGHPDWSYSPSVGGFDPDAQYKAPLILTQASDWRGLRGIRSADQGYVPFAGEQTRSRIQSNPPSSWQKRLSPGMQIRRVHFRPCALAFQRSVVCCELN